MVEGLLLPLGHQSILIGVVSMSVLGAKMYGYSPAGDTVVVHCLEHRSIRFLEVFNVLVLQ